MPKIQLHRQPWRHRGYEVITSNRNCFLDAAVTPAFLHLLRKRLRADLQLRGPCSCSACPAPLPLLHQGRETPSQQTGSPRLPRCWFHQILRRLPKRDILQGTDCFRGGPDIADLSSCLRHLCSTEPHRPPRSHSGKREVVQRRGCRVSVQVAPSYPAM